MMQQLRALHRKLCSARSPIHFHHYGQSEEETSSENVEAQAPQAPEVQSTQETHLAEVTSAAHETCASDLGLTPP